MGPCHYIYYDNSLAGVIEACSHATSRNVYEEI